MTRTLHTPDLTLSQLELFVRIADAGSLSAAARQLQLTPAAASAALKRLEAAFGARLVERSTRSMRLTGEGELLRDHARRALGELDDARAQLGAGRETLSGDIHLAAPSDLGRGALSAMLDRFIEQHPGVRLTLYLSDTVQDLVRERVDLAGATANCRIRRWWRAGCTSPGAWRWPRRTTSHGMARHSNLPIWRGTTASRNTAADARI